MYIYYYPNSYIQLHHNHHNDCNNYNTKNRNKLDIYLLRIYNYCKKFVVKNSLINILNYLYYHYIQYYKYNDWYTNRQSKFEYRNHKKIHYIDI